jgi:hypothetical protein
LVEQLSRRCVINLPTGETTKNATLDATATDVKPANLAFLLSQRKANSNVRDLGAALTMPMLKLRLFGNLLTVAKKMLPRTPAACALGRSFIIICIEVEIHRAARALRQTEFMHRVGTLRRVCLDISLNIFGTSPNPPLA